MGGVTVEKRAFGEEEGPVRLGGAPEWLAEASLCGGRKEMVVRQQPGRGHPREEDGADLLVHRTMKNRNRWENSGERKVFVIKTRF